MSAKNDKRKIEDDYAFDFKQVILTRMQTVTVLYEPGVGLRRSGNIRE